MPPAKRRPLATRRTARRIEAGTAADVWSAPSGIWFGMLRCYLGLFALLAPHRGHARQEHRLIEGSIVDAYDYHRSLGVPARRAARLAFKEHISELRPLAMVQKTGHDAAYAPRSRHPYWLRLAAAPVGFFLVVGAALGVSNLAPAAEAGVATPHIVGRLFPAGDPRAGQIEVLGESATSREALFFGSGGTVCLPPGTTAADFPEALPTIAPGDTEACADLRALIESIEGTVAPR